MLSIESIFSEFKALSAFLNACDGLILSTFEYFSAAIVCPWCISTSNTFDERIKKTWIYQSIRQRLFSTNVIWINCTWARDYYRIQEAAIIAYKFQLHTNLNLHVHGSEVDAIKLSNEAVGNH